VSCPLDRTLYAIFVAIYTRYARGSSHARNFLAVQSHKGIGQKAFSIVLGVGEALAYAHEHDIFHGNIKPENILFDANDQIVLTDFHLVSRQDAIIRDQTTEEYALASFLLYSETKS
jgi:serine/threonine protein kinase